MLSGTDLIKMVKEIWTGKHYQRHEMRLKNKSKIVWNQIKNESTKVVNYTTIAKVVKLRGLLVTKPISYGIGFSGEIKYAPVLTIGG